MILFIASAISIGCKTGQNYRLSEALPNYSEFEGKSVDPLLEEQIQIPNTQIEKYDLFFQKAKLIVIRIKIAKKLTDNKDHSDVSKLKLAAILAKDLPEIAREADFVLKLGKELVENAKDDFTGMDAVKLPGVISELGTTTSELSSALADLPVILKNVANLIQSGGSNSNQIAVSQLSSNSGSAVSSGDYKKFTGKKDTELRLTKSLDRLRKFQQDLEQFK